MGGVLCCVDRTARRGLVFARAAQQARWLGVGVELLRVVPPVPEAAVAFVRDDDVRASVIEAHRAELLALAAGAPDVATALHVVEAAGEPWHEIVEAATRLGARMIVLGSHGYGGWDGLLGTVAGQVANRAGCDVLVVHEGSGGGR